MGGQRTEVEPDAVQHRAEHLLRRDRELPHRGGNQERDDEPRAQPPEEPHATTELPHTSAALVGRRGDAGGERRHDTAPGAYTATARALSTCAVSGP